MRSVGVEQCRQWARRLVLFVRLQLLPGSLFALASFIGPTTQAGPVPAWCPAGPSEHGGGLNACGCHFNRKTGECHCHRPRACGCACQPSNC